MNIELRVLDERGRISAEPFILSEREDCLIGAGSNQLTYASAHFSRTISINEPSGSIQPTHARVFCKDGVWSLQDLQTPRGTVVTWGTDDDPKGLIVESGERIPLQSGMSIQPGYTYRVDVQLLS